MSGFTTQAQFNTTRTPARWIYEMDANNMISRARYGGTIAGYTVGSPPSLDGAPTLAEHAVTKSYVDLVASGNGPFLPLSGGSVVGKVSIDPPAANWGIYQIGLDIGTVSDSFAGMRFVSNDPTVATVSLERYGSGLWMSYGGVNSWTGDIVNFNQTSVDFKKPVTLYGPPTASNQAANKSYVDNAVAVNATLPSETVAMGSFYVQGIDPGGGGPYASLLLSVDYTGPFSGIGVDAYGAVAIGSSNGGYNVDYPAWVTFDDPANPNGFGVTMYVNGSAMLAGSIATRAPGTITAVTYTVAPTDASLVLAPSATMTLTLPPATGANSGRMLWLKLTTAHAVNAANPVVVPMAGGAPGTAIMTATAGKFCMLQSDGAHWQVMNAN